MRKPGALPLAAGAVAAALAAGAAARAETVRPGETTGLGLFGHEIPAVLKHAKADPYAAPEAPACESIPREIAALDAVLGPDADAPARKVGMEARAGRLMGQAIRGMIPHRDLVRLVTGAGRKDQKLKDAAMAGWARRGFLKGMEINLGCAGREASQAAAATPAATTAQDAAAVAPVAQLRAIAPLARPSPPPAAAAEPLLLPAIAGPAAADGALKR